VFAKRIAYPFRNVEPYDGVAHSVPEHHQLALVLAHIYHSLLEQDRCVLVRFPRFRSKNISPSIPLDPVSNTYKEIGIDCEIPSNQIVAMSLFFGVLFDFFLSASIAAFDLVCSAFPMHTYLQPVLH